MHQALVGPGADRLRALLHLAALSALAVAQPLLDLVARHPPFLVAHRASRAGAALLALSLSVGLPLLLFGVEALAGLAGARVRRALHLGFVAALLFALALPVLHRAVGAPDAAALAGAAALAAAGTLAYARVAAFRTLLALASPAALLAPALFLSHAELREALAPAPAAAPAAAHPVVSRPVPVVFVVFDGLRLADLLDAEGGIDAARYPGFGELAGLSTWYRNTTTVAESTLLALPAILTGRYPDPARAPTLRANPGNLFTLLAGSHEIVAFEPITSLCPPAHCRELLEPQGPAARARALATDLAVLYLHWCLPPGVAADRLPPITEKWAHFEGVAQDPGAARDRGDRSADRLAVFDRFLEALEPPRPGAPPRLYFLHLLLPHGPYAFLPSGRTHNPPRQPLRAWRHGLGEVWERDPQGTLQAEKLYLMHVALVDSLVSRLLARLRETEILDASLLVVTSDHGQTFRAGHSHRVADPETRSDLLPVPLFAKAPGQREGRIDDTPLENVDVLPTLAAVLGAEPAWRVEGRDAARAGARAERFVQRKDGRLAVPVDGAPWRAALDRKLELFGAGTPVEEMLRAGPLRRLVGAPVEELETEELAPYAFELHDAGLYDAVDPGSRMLPAFVHGRLVADAGAQARPALIAVAIGGRVAAVTTAYPGPDGLRFQAIVAESAFAPGHNRVELFAVRKEGASVRLLRVRPL